MDDFGWVQARALARRWHSGSGQMHELAEAGTIGCAASLRREVESCLADLMSVRRECGGDDILIGEMAQMKRFLGWVQALRPADWRADSPCASRLEHAGSKARCPKPDLYPEV